jgi:DNA-binding MarR family transcriptional regulator
MRIDKFLTTSPLFSLYVAYDQVLRDFQDRLKSEDLHFIQALIVTGLFFEGQAVQPSELAATLKCSRSNISHAIRDLEKKGLLERATKSSDARAYYISLTKSGKKKASRLIKIFDSTQDQMEAAGGRDLNSDLKRFLETYQRI